MNASTFNRNLLLILPSAWICGVRLSELGEEKAETRVRYQWINQNPFRSMFWAVQGMAAELSAGAMVLRDIRSTGSPVSMLVVSNRATFSKKARGRIRFTCEDGALSRSAISRALESGEGQTFWMKSVGRDEQGDVVATFEFEWSVRSKKRPDS